MTEDWAPIPSADGYFVSRSGAVRGPRGAISTPATKRGYLTCSIRINGQKATTTVQRLVLLAFVGPPPSARHEANHKNGRKQDNAVENLEWVTRVENMRHAWDTGLMRKRRPAPKNDEPEDTRQTLTLRIGPDDGPALLHWRLTPIRGQVRRYRVTDADSGAMVTGRSGKRVGGGKDAILRAAAGVLPTYRAAV